MVKDGNQWESEVRKLPQGELLRQVPLARHTSWRVGGKADKVYVPKDLNDLVAFLQELPFDEPLTWLGLGSNVLVRDGGVRGTVIITHQGLSNLSLLEDNTVRAESGVACAKVARFTVRNSLMGAEFLAGIPGTVGGALAMNAGAFGGETWHIVRAVETINRFGKLKVRLANEFQSGYRELSGLNDEWFVSAQFSLVPGDDELAMERIRECLSMRNQTQPTSNPSCGSVFKNPPGNYAAYLIELSGLKGESIGDAVVSEKHANFILNMGHAKARDIEALIEKVRDEVERQQQVRLDTEVRIIGEADSL